MFKKKRCDYRCQTKKNAKFEIRDMRVENEKKSDKINICDV